MSSTVVRNNVDMLLEAAEKIRENEDAIKTKLDIMSMPVYIENEPMNIDEVIGKGYILLFYKRIYFAQNKLFSVYLSIIN